MFHHPLSHRGLRSALLFCAFAATPALADTPSAAPNALMQHVYDCRTITESAARLACFDQQVAALQSAEQSHDIRVVDREQVREARRGLFGFSLGNLNIFGNGHDDAENDVEIIQQIDAHIRSVGRNESGRWVFTLDNGQRWIQNDSSSPGRSPHDGQAISIHRASLGSYMASVEGRPGIRVRRDQ